MISAQQIKAARAMLDWSQDMLAQASGLSPNTIISLEKGNLSPRSATEVKKAFEKEGFEFHGKSGVNRRYDEIRTYEGIDATEKFYDDMLSTVREKGGDIFAIYKSQEIFFNSLGIEGAINLNRLDELNKFANLQCLLTEARELFAPDSACQFRAVIDFQRGPWSLLTYGDKHAIVLKKNADFVYIVMRSVEIVQTCIKEFMPLWNKALPLALRMEPQKRRA
jgi:DNA-binding XRE family transcriptional regulator